MVNDFYNERVKNWLSNMTPQEFAWYKYHREEKMANEVKTKRKKSPLPPGRRRKPY